MLIPTVLIGRSGDVITPTNDHDPLPQSAAGQDLPDDLRKDLGLSGHSACAK